MNGPTLASPTTPRAAAARPPAAARPAVKPDADPAVIVARFVAWAKMYWLTVLFLGGLLGSALAFAAWTLLPSKYESYAQLRVASAPFTVSNQKDPNRGRTEFNTYLKTNAKLIRNEFVLSKALLMEIDGLRVSELPTIKDQANPLQFLEEEIQVPTPADGVELITVSMKGHNPADVQTIVNAVVKAYLDEVIEKEIVERSAFLRKVDDELVKLQSSLTKRVQKAPIVPPAGEIVPAGGIPAVPAVAGAVPESVRRQFVSLLVSRLNALQEQADSLPLTIQSQKGRVESVQKQIAALTQGPPAAETLAFVDADPEVRDIQQREKAFRAKYNQARATYTNPDAEVLRVYLEQADAAAAEAKKLKEKKILQLETARRQGKADPLFPKLDEETRRLRDLEDQLRAADANLKKARAELAALPPDPVRDDPKTAEPEKKPLVDPDSTYILAEDDSLRGLASHAVALRLDIESPRRVSVLQKASVPQQKDTKKQIIGTVFAGLLGFALVGLAVVGYESKIKKVSGLLDLKATTAVPVVGVIPYTPDWQAAQDPLKRAEVAEAVDKLRAYVAQSYLARGATTVAVTSPLSDEGKSFAAFRLASSLAAGGYKTLLVDFDLRNPTLHTLAGVDNPTGVCDLLRGESDLRKSVQVLPTGLHLLPAGVWSDDARQAAVGGKLESLLARLKEPFDCVIVHAHALLAAAETVEVARRCEVVLLAALYRDTRLPLLKKAADRLGTMEVPYTGLVYLGATPHEALC